MRFISLCLAVLALSGCSLPNFEPTLDTSKKYKMNAHIKVNKLSKRGLIVAAPANSYDIVVTLRDESKYIAYRNCHGEEVDHRFNSSRLQFIYQPISRLEREEQCPMFIYGVTDKSQKHSYGMIVFEDPDGAPGKVLCNWGINDGTTTGCQSRVGTMQEIQFSQPMVRANKTGKCAVDTIKISDTHYEYVMPLDDCVIVFLELEGERMHKHYTYGYNGIIPE